MNSGLGNSCAVSKSVIQIVGTEALKAILFKTVTMIFLLLILSATLAMANDESREQIEQLKAWKLAFVRDGNIWVANGDGTDQTRIIRNAQAPSWSPDKKRVAFVRDSNIWVAAADGRKQRPLTYQWKKNGRLLKPDFVDIRISWNPRYDSVTFSHQEFFKVERVGGTKGLAPYSRYAPKNVILGNSIFDVPVSGKSPEKAVPRYDLYGHEGGASNYFVDQGFPAWSASGKRLAFVRAGDIWVTDVIEKEDEEDLENFDTTRVAAVAVYDEPTLRASRQNLGATTLSWTPDEKQLLYGYQRLGGSGTEEVHLLDLSSGKDIRLLRDAAVIDPVLSPNGKFFVYWSYECGDDKNSRSVGNCIRLASIDGKTRQQIVANGQSPNW
jgi:Tol biopolymer transport system component